MRDAGLLIARLMMAAAFLPPGIARALNIPGFALALASGGVPWPSLVATAAVVVNLFGPPALVLGLAPRVAAGSLAALAGLTALGLHRFWDYAGGLRATEQAAFLADTALVAGLLFYAASGPGAWSWQAWWRRLPGVASAPAGKAAPARPSARSSARPTPRGAPRPRAA
jgi:putative oxidoreductase